MTIYLYVGADNIIDGWGSTYSEGMLEHDLEPDDPVLQNFGILRYVDGKVVADDSIGLDNAKIAKDEELNLKCKEAILAGFEYSINGTVYWFSYDIEAQGNFRDGREALRDGLASVLPWTVRVGGIDGPYDRIIVDFKLLMAISMAGMIHKTEKINKYRDFLMPIVNQAKEVEEVESVVW